MNTYIDYEPLSSAYRRKLRRRAIRRIVYLWLAAFAFWLSWLGVVSAQTPPTVWLDTPSPKEEGVGAVHIQIRAKGDFSVLEAKLDVESESAARDVDFCFPNDLRGCSIPVPGGRNGISFSGGNRVVSRYISVENDDEAEGNETFIVKLLTGRQDLRYKVAGDNTWKYDVIQGGITQRAVITDNDGEDAGRRFLIPYKAACSMTPKDHGVRLTRGDGFRDWYLNSTVEINNAATDQFYYTQGTLRREGGRDHIQPSETWFGKNAANSVRGWRKIRHGDDTPLAQIFSGQGSSIGFTTNKSSGDFNPKRQYCDRLDVSFGNYPHVTNVDKLLVRRDTHDSNSEGIMLEFYGLEVEGFKWEHSEDSAIDHLHLLDQAGAVYAVKDHRSSSTSSWRLTYINSPNCKDGYGCVQGTIDSDEVNSVGGGRPHWLNFEEDSTCNWKVVKKHGSGGVSPKVENNRPYIRNERGYTSRWEYRCF